MIFYRNQWVAFSTLLNKEIIRLFRIWAQTIVPTVVTTILYFMVFGQVLGSRIGAIDGVPYIQFMTPGLIMLAVVNNSFINVVSTFFFAKFIRSIEEFLVAPMSYFAILMGFVLGGTVRGVMNGLIVALIALFFTPIHILHPGVMCATLILTSLLFGFLGFVNAVFAKTFDSINIVPTFVLTPLLYLGGIFYSIHMLPEPWHMIAQWNPILYVINAFRYSLLGVTDISIGYTLMVISVCTFVLGSIAWWLLSRGIGIKS